MVTLKTERNFSEELKAKDKLAKLCAVSRKLETYLNHNWLWAYIVMYSIDFKVPISRLTEWGEGVDCESTVALLEEVKEEVETMMHNIKLNERLLPMAYYMLSNWEFTNSRNSFYDKVSPIFKQIIIANPCPYDIYKGEELNYLIDIVSLHLYRESYPSIDSNLINSSSTAKYSTIMEDSLPKVDKDNYRRSMIVSLSRFLHEELY